MNDCFRCRPCFGTGFIRSAKFAPGGPGMSRCTSCDGTGLRIEEGEESLALAEFVMDVSEDLRVPPAIRRKASDILGIIAKEQETAHG